MVDGAAGVAMRFGVLAGLNHLHPASDGGHGRAACRWIDKFQQHSIMRVVGTRTCDFLQRLQGIAPLVSVGWGGVAQAGLARPNGAKLLLAVAIALDDRLRGTFGIVLM